MNPTPLPIASVLDDLKKAVAENSRVILEAPPGAGKTTRVPPALMGEKWLGEGKILMLEPRRLAARAAARFMARRLGQGVGKTVGYRTRMDSRVSAATRIEVLTEGILARMVQHDPELSGVGAVIFDEFHERHLQADLGLALCLDVQSVLRPDLRLVVMSATLDLDRLETVLAPVKRIRAQGRVHPVRVHYRPPARGKSLAPAVAFGVKEALEKTDGGVLAFLPGAGEIRKTAALLEETGPERGIPVFPLFGDLPRETQDAAIAPAAAGKRKIVLATDIAESSLTIEGITAVVDSGLRRTPRFDPKSGMTRLETVRISRASARQRKGRAGRTGPGSCFRLWSEAIQHGLAEHAPAEILGADLAPLALELALWGSADAADLAWIDPPPAGALAQARDLLAQLGALDDGGRITSRGKKIAGLAAHPRLAHMILSASKMGQGELARLLAVLISGRDPFRSVQPMREADLRPRVEAFTGRGHTLPAGIRHRILDEAGRLGKKIGGKRKGKLDPEMTGTVLAMAYPDRIAARRKGGRGRFLLSGGRGAWLPETDPLAGADFLVAARLDAGDGEARIHLAAVITENEVRQQFSGAIRSEKSIAWNRAREAVECLVQERLGRIVLSRRPLAAPDPDRVMRALAEGIRQKGLHILPWSRRERSFQARVGFLRRTFGPDHWPDLADSALGQNLETWLGPFLLGFSRLPQLSGIDLGSALRSQLTWQQAKDLDRLAPTHVQVPSGSLKRLDYSGGEAPVLAVKLQEMFGATATPAVAGGRVPLRLHLLSPAGRPVQVTDDLAGFWKRTYHDVRKDLRGRYPKHPWPEDPLTAVPTRGVVRRRKPS